MRTLVLNAGYEPLAVVTFRRALVLVLTGKASVVAEGRRSRRRAAGDPGPSVRDPPATATSGPGTTRSPPSAAGASCAATATAAPTAARQPTPSTMSSPNPGAVPTPGRTWWPPACAATTSRATTRPRRWAGSSGSFRLHRMAPSGRSRNWRSPTPALGSVPAARIRRLIPSVASKRSAVAADCTGRHVSGPRRARLIRWSSMP